MGPRPGHKLCPCKEKLELERQRVAVQLNVPNAWLTPVVLKDESLRCTTTSEFADALNAGVVLNIRLSSTSSSTKPLDVVALIEQA